MIRASAQRTCLGLWLAFFGVADSHVCASDEKSTPEVSITLERPKSVFVLGQPIELTVTFQNGLKRDVLVRGFNPEYGVGLWGTVFAKTVMGQKGGGAFANGVVVQEGTRSVIATTDVELERLSGKSKPGGIRKTIAVGRQGRSFVLKTGQSVKQSFDLMQTSSGQREINTSPGRFRVSLTFRVVSKASQGWVNHETPPEWEGETRAVPIEVEVVARKPVDQDPNKPSPATSASRPTATP